MERLTLETTDGITIEAEVEAPSGASAAVVLAHPHPLYGGSMRDGAPAFLFEHLPAEGVAALRFNFRGVGASTGAHDNGGAERLDLLAAIGALAEAAPSVPLLVAGWSFGADVSLCVDDERIAAWCPIAPPLSVVPLEEMTAATDPRPKHLLVPEHDQYDPPGKAAALTAGWSNTTIEVLTGTDHFLGGSLAQVTEAVLAVLRRV